MNAMDEVRLGAHRPRVGLPGEIGGALDGRRRVEQTTKAKGTRGVSLLMSHQQLADPAFRADQHACLREPHIAPITALVEELSGAGKGFIPYVAPMFGRIHAEVLCVLRDPGPKTPGGSGSGMLCVENDDPSAALFAECLDAAGLAAARIVTWNAYPWYINKEPSSAQLNEGVGPLKRLLDLLPEGRVVVLMGLAAESSWARLTKRYGVASRRWTSIATRHPSGRGITRGGQMSRAEGISQLTADLGRARDIADNP